MSTAKVGQAAPTFALTCVSAAETNPRLVRLSDYAGDWLVLIFYPRDFSFVCPTELTAFSAHLPEFAARDCKLLGVSVDSIELHREWLTAPASEGGLGPLQFPLASDPEGRAARAYGVWVEKKAVSTRGLFVIDPEGILQYAVIHNLSVGRRPDVVLRVIDALRTGGLCAANWSSADGTIDPEHALQSGRVLGHYRIRGRLGGGTFGTVFAAWDLRLERLVALKVLRRNVIESRGAVLNEARAAARLSHPHICTIYAVEEEDGLPVIAMEYLSGRPLSQIITEGLKPDSALRLAAQIASGLAAAHRQDVIHGDLKPENIIVTQDDAIKILDFGLAKSQSHATSSDPDTIVERRPGDTRDESTSVDSCDATVEYAMPPSGSPRNSSAMIGGTPAYMSPEQARGLPATPASDVFSYGLVFFEMLTGRRARAEQSPVELLLGIATRDLAPELAQQVAEIHRELLTQVLAREPARRPSMTEVVRRLAP